MSHRPVQTLVTKAFSPQNYGVSIHRKPLRNCDIGLARSGGQNNTPTQSHLLSSAVRRGPLLEFSPVLLRKADTTSPRHRITRLAFPRYLLDISMNLQRRRNRRRPIAV